MSLKIMMSWLGLVLLFCCMAGYLAYLRGQHAQVLARSRGRAMRGDSSITTKMTFWGTLREIPAPPKEGFMSDRALKAYYSQCGQWSSQGEGTTLCLGCFHDALDDEAEDE